jgi:TolB-like protein/DNA-binding winged helix-turn-helix (wHTH) protein/Flp pilus assembly protein TadD
MSATKSSAGAVLRCRFGPYEADLSRDELRKFGLRIRLEAKPWHLLVALLKRHGELVTRSELQQALWGEDVFVDFEHGLNVAVKKLRGALCDSVEVPAYIETVAGEGYRFVAVVEHVVFAPAGAAASASLESIADTLVPAYSSMQLAEALVPQLEQGAEPRLLAGSIGRSWWRNRKVRRAVAVAVCVALLAIAVARLTWRRLRQRDHVHAGKVMLVVLPFENLSSDPNQEYFSDGMTEELSQKLGNQDPRQLGVIGRTTAMTYKYSHRTIGDIGRDLGVDYVLEGSVRRWGSKVRITAQLVQVSDQAHVWAGKYDENVRDLLQLESELAGEIARQVGVSIALGQATKPAKPHIPNAGAHEAYLLGRYSWYKRTAAGSKTGEEYFRRAIQKDPEYAAAYAGLAECRIPRSEAQAAALKAIALDSASGEAYTALAWVQLYGYLDPSAAEPAFKDAIQLTPNYAQAHYWYGAYLGFIGHPNEAIDELKQALLLDPLSSLFRAGLAGELLQAGQQDEAIKQLRIVFATDPNFAVGHGVLGGIYTQQGKYREAIDEFRTEARLDGHSNLSEIGYAYALWGKKNEALRALSQLKKLGSAPADLAVVELGLSHKEKALAWLEKAYQDHDDDILLYLKVYPVFDPLRSDPRFQDLLRRMNFPL